MPDVYDESNRGNWKALADRCLDAPAFHRNHGAITNVLLRLLGDRTGNVIEIGSGTGQHVITFAAALPHLIWWPSDPAPSHRASINAWRARRGLMNVRRPIDLDAAASDWKLGEIERPPSQEIDAILVINVLHITPWPVSLGLMQGAARYLKSDGMLIVYGPFAQGGVHVAPSNAAFDTHLRKQNDGWGVRDSADLNAAATTNGLKLAEMLDMPANNTTLVFERG
ncbi:MAG: DUF938 domain-containing protein [Geminicoccaceae bacterium]